MRRVNYIVKRQDGTKFTTTDYSKATSDGNRIFETFLTEIKDENPKVLEQLKKRAAKIKEILSQKGSL